MNVLAAIASVGARTSVGLTAPHTGFLLRAGAAGMHFAPLIDSEEEAVTFCVLTTLDPLSVGADRAAAIAIPAMEEALAPLGPRAASLRLKLILCMDASLAGAKGEAWNSPIASAGLVARVQARAKELCPQLVVELCVRGAAGPALILEGAISSLSLGQFDAVLLGGVHTDYDPARITALETQGRLFSPKNLDALIPGECAAFALLMRPELARHAQLPVHSHIVSIGTGFETATPDNDHPAYEAKGLTAAIKMAAAPLVASRLTAGWALTDLSFELRRISEWQAMVVRTHKIWGEPHLLDNPAQRLGYLGAAALPLHLALAQTAWRHGYAPSPIAVAYAGSDAGDRGVIVLAQA